MPLALNAQWSVVGQTDELWTQKGQRRFLPGTEVTGTHHTVRLFDKFWRITPGSLENVVERRAQMLVVFSRFVVQEFLWRVVMRRRFTHGRRRVVRLGLDLGPKSCHRSWRGCEHIRGTKGGGGVPALHG